MSFCKLSLGGWFVLDTVAMECLLIYRQEAQWSATFLLKFSVPKP
jgi:hypothetical protein